MQGGRLKPDEKQSKKPMGGLARWVFDDGSALLLTEAGKEKRAGVWVIPAGSDLTTTEPFVGLGPDADALDLDGAPRRSSPSTRCASTACSATSASSPASAAAWPTRSATGRSSRRSPTPRSSTADESERLFVAIGECIAESLAYERGRADMSSSKERPGAVHHREGDPCPVCGDVVRAVEYNRYTVNYCATCQTGGKVLADNTTSKFLK